MDVLIIGGSVFLGRALAAEAVAAGHDVTVFNRGRSGTPPDGVRHLRGDRTVPRDLAQLRARHFDLVIDSCGYVPAEVDLSAQALATSCDHYTFVSSINAYPGWPEDVDYRTRGAHFGDPDATRADLPAGIDDAQAYGWLKVGCEAAVQRTFGPDRSSVLRAGCIVGPDDSAVGRLPWWVDRVARGGEVLVPGAPGDPVSLIDARDLARFALQRVAGVFETPGPTGRDSRAELMAACLEATSSDATFTYVADDWLREEQVEAWTEVPLWIARTDGPSLFTHHSGPAEQAGLTWRPLTDTVTDTWQWQQHVDGGWRPAPRTPGLPRDKEQALLAAWHAR